MVTKFATPSHILENIPGLFSGPGGAVTVLQGGEVKAQQVWGMADMDRRIAVNTKTQMPICSISKQMLCLVMVDLGRNPTEKMAQAKGDVWAQLTKELGNMLPQLKNHVDGELTIAHLYNMQSGFRDYWAETCLWGAKPDDPFSIADDAPRTLERTKSFQFKPGTEFSYCNVNFHVLGRLVEKVSGHSLGQLLAERVFIPAGMTTAALTPNTFGPPLPIIGYEGDEKHGYVPAVNRIEWSGDAGITASLEDMIAYEAYLDRSWADSKSSYRTMAEQQTYLDGSPATYGFGLGRSELAGKTVLGHGGALRGFRLHRVHVPSERISVVVMYNHEGNPAVAAEAILKRALNVPEGDTNASASKPAAEWKGNFLDAETQLVIKVDVSDAGELSIDIAGGPEKMKMIDATHADRVTMTASIDGDTISVHRKRDNRHYTGKRIAKPIPSNPTASQNRKENSSYAGTYHSSELQSTFIITGGGSPHVMYGSFDGFLGMGPVHLMRYVGEDVWLLACPRGMDAPAPGDWTVVFHRGGGENGEMDGVTVGCWLARKVVYKKIA